MVNNYRNGWIEVIVGCMFAGKTEELIKRIKVLHYAKKKLQVFKPRIDNRYSEEEIASHCGSRYQSQQINKAREILDLVEDDCVAVFVDEVQFLDQEIVAVSDILAKRGIRVILAGLDTDFRGEPFAIIPELMANAEFVTKLAAVCSCCGSAATRTQRLINHQPAKYTDPIILIGAMETYEPRCRHCHQIIKK